NDEARLAIPHQVTGDAASVRYDCRPAARKRLVYDKPEGFILRGQHEDVGSRVHVWQTPLVHKAKEPYAFADTQVRRPRLETSSQGPLPSEDQVEAVNTRTSFQQVTRSLPWHELSTEQGDGGPRAERPTSPNGRAIDALRKAGKERDIHDVRRQEHPIPGDPEHSKKVNSTARGSEARFGKTENMWEQELLGARLPRLSVTRRENVCVRC